MKDESRAKRIEVEVQKVVLSSAALNQHDLLRRTIFGLRRQDCFVV